MLILDKARAKRILTAELDYQPAEADIFLADFPSIHDELASPVRRWLDDRVILDVIVYGLSLSELMQVRGSHFLMAIRELNRLLDSDLTPERRERLIEIMKQRPVRW